MSEETNNTENVETTTDFFESTLNIDTEVYDHNVAFDLIEKMYKEGQEYKVSLNKYKEYQKKVNTLTDEQKSQIITDERFPDIQSKLKWIEKFDTNNL